MPLWTDAPYTASIQVSAFFSIILKSIHNHIKIHITPTLTVFSLQILSTVHEENSHTHLPLLACASQPNSNRWELHTYTIHLPGIIESLKVETCCLNVTIKIYGNIYSSCVWWISLIPISTYTTGMAPLKKVLEVFVVNCFWLTHISALLCHISLWAEIYSFSKCMERVCNWFYMLH
jgi:hypothetical protein